MNPEFAESRVTEIIADQLGIAVEEVRPEHTFTDDLGADNLDFLELVMALEEEFNIDIDDESAEKLQSVEDVIDYIGSSLIKG